MTMTLDELFSTLDRYTERIPIEDLIERLRDLSVRLDDVRDHARFDPAEYQSNLMRTGPAYEALLLCWEPGQRSPIHDHRGSSCGVVVISGTLTETTYRRRLGWIYAARSTELREGQVCGSLDLDTHEIANLDPDGRRLITMHIYSPPLHEMGIYSLDTSKVEVRKSTARRPEPPVVTGGAMG